MLQITSVRHFSGSFPSFQVILTENKMKQKYTELFKKIQFKKQELLSVFECKQVWFYFVVVEVFIINHSYCIMFSMENCGVFIRPSSVYTCIYIYHCCRICTTSKFQDCKMINLLSDITDNQ